MPIFLSHKPLDDRWRTGAFLLFFVELFFLAFTLVVALMVFLSAIKPLWLYLFRCMEMFRTTFVRLSSFLMSLAFDAACQSSDQTTFSQNDGCITPVRSPMSGSGLSKRRPVPLQDGRQHRILCGRFYKFASFIYLPYYLRNTVFDRFRLSSGAKYKFFRLQCPA